MQIGICGLLPDQVRWVQQEFPQHALRFLDKDHESEALTFAKGCDKVVLMTKFIGHHLQDRVQPSKRILVTGGTTKLKQVLAKLPTPAKDVTPARASHPTLPASLTAKPALPSRKGRWGVDEVVDYSELLHPTHVGQVITIKRPKSCTLAAFNMRVSNARTRAKKHGIVTTPHKMVDGGAVMTIKAIGNVAVHATAPPETAPPEATQETEAMQIAVDVQRSVAVVPALTQARESAFWQSVFVETMKQWPGAPIDTIAARADEALRAYNARAGMTVSAH